MFPSVVTPTPAGGCGGDITWGSSHGIQSSLLNKTYLNHWVGSDAPRSGYMALNPPDLCEASLLISRSPHSVRSGSAAHAAGKRPPWCVHCSPIVVFFLELPPCSIPPTLGGLSVSQQAPPTPGPLPLLSPPGTWILLSLLGTVTGRPHFHDISANSPIHKGSPLPAPGLLSHTSRTTPGFCFLG